MPYATVATTRMATTTTAMNTPVRQMPSPASPTMPQLQAQGGEAGPCARGRCGPPAGEVAAAVDAPRAAVRAEGAEGRRRRDQRGARPRQGAAAARAARAGPASQGGAGDGRGAPGRGL